MANPEILTKIVFVLGLTNLVGLFLIFFSCRCGIMKYPKLSTSKTYMWFYKYHCYYWWFFLLSVLVHAILGLVVIGFPFN